MENEKDSFEIQWLVIRGVPLDGPVRFSWDWAKEKSFDEILKQIPPDRIFEHPHAKPILCLEHYTAGIIPLNHFVRLREYQKLLEDNKPQYSLVVYEYGYNRDGE